MHNAKLEAVTVKEIDAIFRDDKSALAEGRVNGILRGMTVDEDSVFAYFADGKGTWRVCVDQVEEFRYFTKADRPDDDCLCTKCGRQIAHGDDILWAPDTDTSTHVKCEVRR